MQYYELFLKQVAARTEENEKSFNILYSEKCFGMCISIIRMEIDSLIRLRYLWEESTPVKTVRELIQSSVNFGEWKAENSNGKIVRVTDQAMLEKVVEEGGWEVTAYEFGCQLVHLSNAHRYKEQDPLTSVPLELRQKISGYLSAYHQYPDNDVAMENVIAYLPKIYEKAKENVEFYVKELEEKLK